MNAADAEKLLAELEALLAEQIALAKAGDLKRLAQLTGGLEELVGRASACGPMEQCRDRRERLGRLYDELCLTLAARKCELAEKLRGLGTGKSLLRAYQFGTDR